MDIIQNFIKVEKQEILLKIEELQEQLNELKSICNEKENW